MREAAELWFERKSPDWAEATKAAYRQQLRAYVLPALGDKSVGQIRHMDTEQLYNQLAKTLSRSTIRQVKMVIDGILTWLKRQGLDLFDARADIPRRLPPPRETRIATDDQIAAIMAAPGWIGTAARTMLLAGLRPGEVLALRHCDIDAGELIVSRAAGRKGLSSTKTRTTRRVPLAPELEAELRALPGSGDDLLFPRRAANGRPDRLIAVSHLGAMLRQNVGISSRQLRTTFGTLVTRDVANVAAMLGHSSSATTLKHYIKPDSKGAAEAVREFERRLRNTA